MNNNDLSYNVTVSGKDDEWVENMGNSIKIDKYSYLGISNQPRKISTFGSNLQKNKMAASVKLGASEPKIQESSVMQSGFDISKKVPTLRMRVEPVVKRNYGPKFINKKK